jgi:hypothetical protein
MSEMLFRPQWNESKTKRTVERDFREDASARCSAEALDKHANNSSTKNRLVSGVSRRLSAIIQRFSGRRRVFRKLRWFVSRRMRRARAALRQRAKRRAERAERRRQQLLKQPGEGLHALEPRLVFDAAAVATADATLEQPADTTDDPMARDAAHGLNADDLLEHGATPVGDGGRREIAFVDSSVDNVQSLIAGLDRSVEVVIIDAASDGVEQIGRALEGRSDVDAIHVFAHGEQGRLFLGTAVLDAASMQGEHLDELTAVRDVLAETGDILIYGCDFTGGEDGLQAAILLGSITGADIAASEDTTGSAALGGDWDLETEVGTLETDAITAKSWAGVLGPLSVSDMSTGTTALDLAQEIVGDGVTIVSASFSGVDQQAATFTGAQDATTGAPNAIGFDTGVILTSGFATDFFGNNDSGSTSRNLTSGGLAELDALNTSGALTEDAAVLDITFIPTESEITMQYVFGSEEYPEYVYSNFNDSWGIFVNGVNIALAPNNLALGINTVNDAAQFNPGAGNDANDPNPDHNPTDGIFESAHQSLYVNNPNVFSGSSAYNVQADGFTVTMSVIANVIPNQVNTIRVALADSGDGSYDSWLLLSGGSFQTSPIARPDVVAPDPISGTTIDVLANDSDPVVIAPGNQPLSISEINGNAIAPLGSVTLASGATVTLNVDNTLTVTSPTNGAASDAFTYTITDGANESIGVVTIANTSNDAPVLSVPGAQTVDQDATSGISGFDLIDIDAGYLDVTATLTVNNGALSVTPFGGLTIAGDGTDTVTITGSVAQIKNALNSLQYTPDAGYTGADTLTVTVNDLGNTGTGGALSDTETVALTVSDLSFIPEINLDPLNTSGGANDRNFEAVFSTAVGSPVNLTDAAIDIADSDSPALASATISLFAVLDGNSERVLFDGTAFQLATNQTQTVTVGGTTFQVAYTAFNRTFAITRSGGGTMPIADLEALFAAVQYENTAANPTSGDRIFSISVSDGTNASNVATSVVQVTTAAPPQLDLDSSDTPAPVVVASDDFLSGSASGGTGWSNAWQEENAAGDILFTAGTLRLRDPDQLARVTRNVDLSGYINPTISFSYTTNGLDAPDTFVIEYSNDGGSNWTTIVDSFSDGNNNNGGTITDFSLGANGTADTVFRARFTAGSGGNAEYFAIDDLEISAQLSGPTSYSTSYDIKVGAAAVASGNVSITDSDDTTLTSATVTLTNAQAGDVLSVSGALPGGISASSYNAATGVLTLSGTASLADYEAAIEALRFSTSSNDTSDRFVEFVVYDTALSSNTARSTITIVPNLAPVADNDTGTTNEDTTLSVAAGSGLLAGDSDPDGDTISVSQFSVAGDPAVYAAGSSATISGVGQIAIAADGSYTFTPAADYNGPVPVITYTLSDGFGGTDTATLTLTVTDVNDLPTATASTSSGNEDTDIAVALGGTDVDGTIATVTVTSLPPSSEGVLYLSDGTTPVVAGTPITAAQAASLIFTPAANFNGTVTIPFTVTDNDGGTSAPANEVITVTPVNDAPTATASTSSGNEDTEHRR